MYDVLCYGALCADNLIRLPRLPLAGDGMRVLSDRTMAGGNALHEARCLSTWGLGVALMGDHLGDDSEGVLLREAVAACPRLDRSFLRLAPGCRTPLCRILITPDGERTVLVVRDNQHPFTLPPADLLARCRAVSVTRFGAGSLEAAGLARQAVGLLVVGDALLPEEPLVALADVIVGSAAQLPDGDVVEQMRRLQHVRGAAVVISDGPRAARALVAGQLYTALPPTIAPVDTTGAGDCFRAGITYGLVRGWQWPRILDRACTAAAAWCMREGNDVPPLWEKRNTA